MTGIGTVLLTPRAAVEANRMTVRILHHNLHSTNLQIPDRIENVVTVAVVDTSATFDELKYTVSSLDGHSYSTWNNDLRIMAIGVTGVSMLCFHTAEPFPNFAVAFSYSGIAMGWQGFKKTILLTAILEPNDLDQSLVIPDIIPQDDDKHVVILLTKTNILHLDIYTIRLDLVTKPEEGHEYPRTVRVFDHSSFKTAS